MAKHIVSPSTPPHAAALTALRTLAGAASPDARLIAACDRFLFLSEQADRLFRLEPRGYMKRVRAMVGEHVALEKEIAKTPAHTVVGMLAKAEVADRMLGKGTMADIPRSVLNDFIRNVSADLGMGEPPELEEA